MIKTALPHFAFKREHNRPKCSRFQVDKKKKCFSLEYHLCLSVATRRAPSYVDTRMGAVSAKEIGNGWSPMIVELHIHNKVHFEISHSCAGSCLNLDPEIYSFEHSCKRRFGLRCELLCPFGYINHTCLTAPIGICTLTLTAIMSSPVFVYLQW